MSFLDRFKIQPKYKSADPDVRLAAVREFSEAAATDEERAAIVALAREDADARVRRAAAGRIEDVEVLAAHRRRGCRRGLRAELLDRLAGVAASSSTRRHRRCAPWRRCAIRSRSAPSPSPRRSTPCASRRSNRLIGRQGAELGGPACRRRPRRAGWPSRSCRTRPSCSTSRRRRSTRTPASRRWSARACRIGPRSSSSPTAPPASRSASGRARWSRRSTKPKRQRRPPPNSTRSGRRSPSPARRRCAATPRLPTRPSGSPGSRTAGANSSLAPPTTSPTPIGFVSRRR